MHKFGCSTAVMARGRLTRATRKIDRYMPMMMIQNLGDFGWKLFSASSYSSTGSTDPAVSAAEGSLAFCTKAMDDIVSLEGECIQVWGNESGVDLGV